jgi:hypothetical protein
MEALAGRVKAIHALTPHDSTSPSSLSFPEASFSRLAGNGFAAGEFFGGLPRLLSGLPRLFSGLQGLFCLAMTQQFLHCGRIIKAQLAVFEAEVKP